VELCRDVMPKVMKCYATPEFLAAMEGHWSGLSNKERKKGFKDQFGDEASTTDTCDTLAHDQLCNPQGYTFSNAYPVASLRAVKAADPSDCAAIGTALEGPLVWAEQ